MNNLQILCKILCKTNRNFIQNLPTFYVKLIKISRKTQQNLIQN